MYSYCEESIVCVCGNVKLRGGGGGGAGEEVSRVVHVNKSP